jgi:hypothetical protein
MKFMEFVENRLQSGCRPKFAVRDEIQRSRRVRNNKRGLLDNIAYEINEIKVSAICVRTVKRKLFQMGYDRRVEKKKMVFHVYSRKSDFPGIENKKLGHLIIIGKSGYLVTSVR